MVYYNETKIDMTAYHSKNTTPTRQVVMGSWYCAASYFGTTPAGLRMKKNFTLHTEDPLIICFLFFWKEEWDFQIKRCSVVQISPGTLSAAFQLKSSETVVKWFALIHLGYFFFLIFLKYFTMFSWSFCSWSYIKVEKLLPLFILVYFLYYKNQHFLTGMVQTLSTVHAVYNDYDICCTMFV